MAAILGISAFYHDSAAALIVDGEIVAAAQEERFSRKKHDSEFPTQAVKYCLDQADLEPRQLDWVGFYEKPLLKFERLLETYLGVAPRGLRSFAAAIPTFLSGKLGVSRTLRRNLPGYTRRFVFPRHHESHAASAFFPSPFEQAAILTIDGVGEWDTATIGVGRGNRIELLQHQTFPHSLGLLYSAFTSYTGFKVNSGEYKVMGLAPYGEPRFAPLIVEHLIDLKQDGSFKMDLSYFDYCHGLSMTSAKFHKLFGGPPRPAESLLTQRDMDLAASIQAVTEEIMLRQARHAHALTGCENLCLAGGVALNCVGNGRILRDGPFKNLWIQPASGDAGGSLGAALMIQFQLLNQPRDPASDPQSGSLLGPEFRDGTIERFLKRQGVSYSRCASDQELVQTIAAELSAGKVVGWFQGRMEFGPRALGARSILGDPRDPEMTSAMNLKIKFRESFRPFAPAVLADRAGEYFDAPADLESPYMLLVAPVHPDKRLDPPNHDGRQLWGIESLKIPRSVIPAVTHVDHSARIQTVDARRFPLFHQLIRAFEERTGCPILINTSFNVRGEPIVCSPSDAYYCFQATGIDTLALGRCIVRKADAPALAEAEREAHLAQFALD